MRLNHFCGAFTSARPLCIITEPPGSTLQEPRPPCKCRHGRTLEAMGGGGRRSGREGLGQPIYVWGRGTPDGKPAPSYPPPEARRCPPSGSLITQLRIGETRGKGTDLAPVPEPPERRTTDRATQTAELWSQGSAAGSLRSGCRQGWFLQKARREKYSGFCPSLLAVSGVCCQSSSFLGL